MIDGPNAVGLTAGIDGRFTGAGVRSSVSPADAITCAGGGGIAGTLFRGVGPNAVAAACEAVERGAYPSRLGSAWLEALIDPATGDAKGVVPGVFG